MQRSDHRLVSERAPLVLAAQDPIREPVFHHGEKHVSIGMRGEILTGDMNALAAPLQAERAVRLGGSPCHRGARRALVAAENVDAAAHHHLRRVDPPARDHRSVVLLAVGEERIRERILPAERVPVVDVLGEADHGRPGNGLGAHEPRQNGIRGRTARAAFGGKQLDEDGNRGSGEQCGNEERHPLLHPRPREVAGRHGKRPPTPAHRKQCRTPPLGFRP